LPAVKNLITGINGFAGSHLADRLLAEHEEVFGLARTLANDKNIKHLAGRIQVYACDIGNAAELKQILDVVRPERIYHLAAVSFVPQAEKNCDAAFQTNLLGTLHLLDAVRDLRMDARILWVGSAEAYGQGGQEENFIDEGWPLEPVSHYGVSKAAADLLAQSYAKRERMDVVRVRPFNHIGPRQDSRFVCSSFARQIAAIESGALPVIKTGNLDSFRDFTDVRDTVRAYHAVMRAGKPGEVFNVCSGTAVSVRFILDTLLEISGARVKVETDPQRFREAKSIRVCGNPQRLRQRTGWRPEISLRQTLEAVLGYWRESG